MKNVLIITYIFPPSTIVGGLRPYGLAKYLPEFCWNPIILTPNLSGESDLKCQIIQTNNEDIVKVWKRRFGLNEKKSLNEIHNVTIKKNKLSIIDKITYIPSEIITFPDAQKGWFRHAIRAGYEVIEKNKIDAIISTSPPITSHLIAKHLSDKYQLPWISDFRDLWTQNPYSNHCFIRKFFERKLEVNTIRNSHALVTVTQPWVCELKKLFPRHQVYEIKNGFDPDIAQNNPVVLTEQFSITYTGILYNGRRDPAILFKAVRNLINKDIIDSEQINIRFFGPIEHWLFKDVKDSRLEGIVQLCGNIPRDQVLQKQRESQLLLLLLWNDPSEKGTIPAKIFEYFATKRPIIALGSPGDSVVKDLINETKTGFYVSNIQQLEEILTIYYSIFKANGSVPSIDTGTFNQYSQKEMARKYARLLNKVSSQEI